MPDKPLEVVCGIIRHKDWILATRRDPARFFPLLWEFPGGKVEAGESPERALERELMEELSLQVEVKERLPTVQYSKDNFHMELIPFECRTTGKHAPSLHDHVELRWLNREELTSVEWAPADIPIVEDLIRKA